MRRLVFDAKSWNLVGHDVDDNSMFWKPAKILRQYYDDTMLLCDVQFDDGRVSSGHFWDSTKPLAKEANLLLVDEIALEDAVKAIRRINAGAEYPGGLIPMTLLNQLEQTLSLEPTEERVVTKLKEGDIILIRGHAERVMKDVVEEPFVTNYCSGPGARLITLGLYWVYNPHMGGAMFPHDVVVPNGTKYVMARPGDWGFDERLGISKKYMKENFIQKKN